MPIDEYLETFANFQNGNYKYRHIRDTEWAGKFIQSGRKIVFGYARIWSSALFIVVVILMVTGIGVCIYSNVKEGFHASESAIFLAIIGAFALPFLIAGVVLWRPRFFYILGPEGIVYKEKKSKEIHLARWRDISVITTADANYRMKSSTITVLEIKILLVDGKMLELDSLSLDLKEFPMEVREISGQQLRDLVAFVFKRYFECYKNK